MESERIFTSPDCWSSGGYTIVVIYPHRDLEQLQSAFAALWRHPALESVFLDSFVDTHTQRRYDPDEVTGYLEEHSYGVFTRHDGVKLACGSSYFLMDGAQDAWLEFYIPMGSLADNDHRVGGFPFEQNRSSKPWRIPLDEQLVSIARRVFDIARFQGALIGFEITVDDVEAFYRSPDVPEERWIGCLVEDQGKLAWHAPTKYDPIFKTGN